MKPINEVKIAVIGLGYVGLPLAVEFSKKYPVVGFDINQKRVGELVAGHDATLEVADASLSSVLVSSSPQIGQKGLFPSFDSNVLGDCTVFIVTVPTPTDKHNRPILIPMLKASENIGHYLKKGDVVIYESTVYPGVTEEDCVPVLEKVSGLKFNTDFYAGYSPERINPGDKVHTVAQIVKVTSGSTPEVADFVDELYRSIITAGTYKASSIKVAEASKVIENSQRDINIAFVNELAKIFNLLGIDTQEVLEAAGTKWNFLKFKPGLVGGHCIGVDPYYLAHKASSLGHTPQVILSGRHVNDQMGAFVADKLIRLMQERLIDIADSKVLILGVTFKENCPDIRNSKVFDIHAQLVKKEINVDVFDPFANAEEVLQKYEVELITSLDSYDGIVLAVAHDFFTSLDFNKLLRNKKAVIFDTKAFLDKSIVTARL